MLLVDWSGNVINTFFPDVSKHLPDFMAVHRAVWLMFNVVKENTAS
jgi:hypothetical protein